MAGKILITGGFGFVGGRLAANLAQAGYSVLLASRKAMDPPIWLPQAKVTQIVWNDTLSLERICKGVDVIVQAAGINSQDCVANPVSALEFNGLATARLVAAGHQLSDALSTKRMQIRWPA